MKFDLQLQRALKPVLKQNNRCSEGLCWFLFLVVFRNLLEGLDKFKVF